MASFIWTPVRAADTNRSKRRGHERQTWGDHGPYRRSWRSRRLARPVPKRAHRTRDGRLARPVRRRRPLARPAGLHLEHRHPRGPRGHRGDGAAAGRPDRRQRLCAGSEDAGPGRRLVRFRDRDGPVPGLCPSQGWPRLTAADRDDRAQGLRGAGRRPSHRRARAPRREGPPHLARRTPGRGAFARPRPAALLPDRRRRPGRAGARRPPQAPRRSDPGHRRPRASGGCVAEPLQVALSARPDLARPFPLPALPRPLAALHLQGQDGRLAGGLHQGDGAGLLGLHGLSERPVR